jgi:hypothetical protein
MRFLRKRWRWEAGPSDGVGVDDSAGGAVPIKLGAPTELHTNIFGERNM